MNIKTLLENQFNLNINEIELIGEGMDSQAYLVNNEYIFKIKFSANKKKGYDKEKAIYDFLNKNMKSSIQIPVIEYSLIGEELSILGYKEIKGNFLSPALYLSMTENQKENLAKDIASFLKQMHSLDCSEINKYKIDNKQNVLEEYKLLKNTIYRSLNKLEKDYIEKFMTRLNVTGIFDGRKCLCHNDFSCNHILLDENNKFCGVIDFGDAGVIDEFCDFVYLFEESAEEIGRDFGMKVVKYYQDIDIEKVVEYQDVVEQYYPIETLVYGVKNNNKEKIEKGRKLIAEYSLIY